MKFLCETNAEGLKVLKYKDNQKQLWLSSFYTPQKKANDYISSVLKPDTEVIFLLGFSGPYLIQAILMQCTKLKNLFVIHPDKETMMPFLDVTEFVSIRDQLNTTFVIAALDTLRAQLNVILEKNFGSIMFDKFQIIEDTPVQTIYKNYFDQTKAIIDDCILKESYSITSRMQIEETQTRNAFINLHHYCVNAGAKVLKNFGKNMPVLIVGAGPSLSDQLTAIQKLNDKLIVICVDTSIGLLIQNQIFPDFIVSADITEQNLDHLDGYWSHFSKIPLVTTGAVPHRLLTQYNGPIYIYQHGHYLFDWGDTYFGKKGAPIIDPINVGFLGISLALHLGASEIFLSGFDFSIINNAFYANGMTQKEIKIEEKNGALFMSKKSKDGSIRKSNIIEPQKNMLTTELLYSYKIYLEKHADILRNKTFNLSENGFHLDGTVRLSISNWMTQFQTKPVINKTELSKKLPDWQHDRHMQKMKKGIHKLSQSLNRYEQICREGIEVIENNLPVTQQKISDLNLTVYINSRIEKIKNDIQFNHIIDKLLAKELYIIKKMENTAAPGLDQTDRSIKQIYYFFQSIHKCVVFLKELIAKTTT